MQKIEPEEKLKAAIGLYRYYINQANKCHLCYSELCDWYMIYDYNMEMAAIHEFIILQLI